MFHPTAYPPAGTIREMSAAIERATATAAYPTVAETAALVVELVARQHPAMRDILRDSLAANSREFFRDYRARALVAAAVGVRLAGTAERPLTEAERLAAAQFAITFVHAVYLRERTRRRYGSVPPLPEAPDTLIYNN